MTQEEALKELESIAETLLKALEEIRALIVAEDSLPNPKLIGVPLREAPKHRTKYWLIPASGDVGSSMWRDDYDDRQCLALGNAYTTKEDAEFATKKRAIFGCPIGEWMPEGDPESIGANQMVCMFPRLRWDERALYLAWIAGNVAWGDEGRAELERRVAAWNELCKEYGL